MFSILYCNMNTSLLDLNNNILNIIGDYVKKDNLEEKLNKEEQILNGKKTTFPCLRWHHEFMLFDENGNYIKDNIKRHYFIMLILK
jgi:hypothetical protein